MRNIEKAAQKGRAIAGADKYCDLKASEVEALWNEFQINCKGSLLKAFFETACNGYYMGIAAGAAHERRQYEKSNHI